MYSISIESSNLEAIDKIKWFLKHLKSEGVRIVENDDQRDLQAIREARKTRDTMPIDQFFESIEKNAG